MNDTLKVAGRIGAELGAALAENEAMREALRWYAEKVAECRKIGSLGDNARQALDLDGGFRARDAISQQAEPTDTYTAVEMATAAAQGFRDGQAAVEPAPAQDERDFNPEHTLFSEIRCSMPVNDDGEETRYIINEQQLQRIRALEFNRPAQTEQQPVAIANRGEHAFWVRWTDEGKSLRGPGIKLYAAPIAQTAPSEVENLKAQLVHAQQDKTATLMLLELDRRKTALQQEQSGWIGVEDRLPEVAAGDEGEFIVCVYRSHRSESYSFSARFLNDYPLHTDYEDEPALHSGWYDVKEHADYDGWYSPLIDEKSGDKVTHWMPLPAAPAMAAQGSE